MQDTALHFSSFFFMCYIYLGLQQSLGTVLPSIGLKAISLVSADELGSPLFSVCIIVQVWEALLLLRKSVITAALDKGRVLGTSKVIKKKSHVERYCPIVFHVCFPLVPLIQLAQYCTLNRCSLRINASHTNVLFLNILFPINVITWIWEPT